MSASDAILVASLLRGDRAAGDALALQHAGAMRAAIRRRLGGAFGPQDVENVFQQAWLRLLEEQGRRLRSYEPSRPLAPFLVGVALNACRDHLKSEGRRRGLPAEVLTSWASLAGGPEIRLESAEALEGLRRALERLSPRDRAILEWVAQESMTHAEVAAILGVAARSVAALASRARQRLRKLLEERRKS